MPQTAQQPAPLNAAEETSNASQPQALTPRRLARSIAIGLMLIPIICYWAMHAEIIIGGSELIEASLLPIVVFTLFLLTLLNDLVRRRWPLAALNRAELILIYVMQTTSVGLAGLGQVQFLNPIIAGIYLRTEDRNLTKFLPHVPRWWTPDPAVLKDYFSGNSSLFTNGHLQGWLIPMFTWSLFTLLMLTGFLCINSLLRRQWVENERLTFPLVALPMELTRAGEAQGLLGRRDFQIAFLLVCIFRSVSAVHQMFPSIPEFANFSPKGQLIDLAPLFPDSPWNALGYFQISFHPMILGIAYLLPQPVSFSAWFFYLLMKGEDVLVTALGFRDAGASTGSALMPYLPEQGAGAFLAVALLSLWGARKHLLACFRSAMGGPKLPDEDREPLSCRMALGGLAVSLLGIVLFLFSGGIPLTLGCTFLSIYLLTIVAVTRLRAEAGPMLSYSPDLNAQHMMVTLPGSGHWSSAQLTAFTFTHWFSADTRTVAMPQQLEAMKMAEGAGISQRTLAKLLLPCAMLGFFAAFLSITAIYYKYGALTPRGDNPWRSFNGYQPFETLKDWVNNPTQPDKGRLQWMGIGFGIAFFMTRAQALWTWWPLHPAGYLMANAGYTMPWVWFPTMMAWLAKGAILRYGGMQLYRRGIPFALGLILGDIVIACVWSLVGIILNTQMYMFFPG